MSLRKLVAVGLLATALVVTALFAARAQARSTLPMVKLSTADSEFAPGTLNNGWWNIAGAHVIGNDNYTVGNRLGQTWRDFFTFDASLLPGCARSVTLQIPTSSFSGSGDNGGATTGGNLVLHDVSTDPVTLNTTAGPDLTIFNDLGTGAFYGSRFLPTVGPYAGDSFTLTLSTAAIHDLNTAALDGDFFSIGGMIAGEPAETALFGFTPVIGPLGKRPVNLLVTLGACTFSS